jgi:TolA-binding protein
MTPNRWVWAFAAGGIAAAGPACWVPAETGAKMQADIETLRAQQQEASKDMAAQRAQLDEQMQRAAKQIDEVAATLVDLNRAARTTDADFGVQLERLQKEVMELRGTLELIEYRLGKAEGKLEGAGSLPERVGALERELKDAATSAPPPPETPKDKKELLLQGRSLIKEGKVAQARGVFRQVIKRWPDEAGITDEAYYRLGELYFDEKKLRSALQEYIKVVEKFAGGKLAAASFYKIGLCSEALGNLEDAQIFFSEVVKNHGRSAYAKDAKKKLDEVKRRLDKEKKNKKSGKNSRKK